MEPVVMTNKCSFEVG